MRAATSASPPRLGPVALACALGAVLAACGGAPPAQPQTYSERAEAAYYEAMEALDDSNFVYAMSQFRRVRDNFELSPYAVLAELRMGDVHFEQGQYRQAAEAYRQFMQLHPGHEQVPYASFRIGMSFYEDMPSDFFLLPPPYERELGVTRSAQQSLGDFLERYGDSRDARIQGYVAEAREAWQEATDRLAGFEFYVGTFYLERARPLAAADHFQTLLDRYPGASQAPDALFLMARCYVELADVETALELLDQLALEYPGHALTRDAESWIREHGLR
jgi:outer membrane protein assembly factor BamD